MMNKKPTFTVHDNGNQEWRLHGKYHRDDGPAVLHTDGTKKWYLHGKLHRDDGPAYERGNGTLMWYQHGLCHREGAPAVIWYNGDQEWHINGQLHRDDGPAIECTKGGKWWCQRGRTHRENGPAVIYANGTSRWYWHGVMVPAHVIKEPHTITVEEVERELNAEVRRVMIERMGLDRYVTQIQLQTVAQDDFGTLMVKQQTGDEDLAVVKVVCPSTGHVHFLRVPPWITSPLRGVAWTFDMSASEYLLTAEA